MRGSFTQNEQKEHTIEDSVVAGMVEISTQKTMHICSPMNVGKRESQSSLLKFLNQAGAIMSVPHGLPKAWWELA